MLIFKPLWSFGGYEIASPLGPIDTFKCTGHRVIGYVITSPFFASEATQIRLSQNLNVLPNNYPSIQWECPNKARRNSSY